MSIETPVEITETAGQGTYTTTEGTQPHPEHKHARRTTHRRNGDVVQMMTEIDDGVFVAWAKCAKCDKDVKDCADRGGPVPPDYIDRWAAERFEKSLRWREKLIKVGEQRVAERTQQRVDALLERLRTAYDTDVVDQEQQLTFDELVLRADHPDMQQPEVCRTCSEVYDFSKGDGYDGECPACADKSAVLDEAEQDDGAGEGPGEGVDMEELGERVTTALAEDDDQPENGVMPDDDDQAAEQPKREPRKIGRQSPEWVAQARQADDEQPTTFDPGF